MAAASSRRLLESFARPFAHASHRAPQPQRARLGLGYFSQPICLTLANSAEAAAGEEDGDEYGQHSFTKPSRPSSKQIDKMTHNDHIWIAS